MSHRSDVSGWHSGIFGGDRRRTTILAALAIACCARAALADNSWVFPSETTLNSTEAVERISHGTADNLCEGVSGILTGGDPGWVRVGGSSNPNIALIQVSGQVLPDFSYKTNPFVNHTDAPFTHYSHDLDVFVTLDPEYRHLLANGNFELGDPNELGELEIEWERGGLPMFAYPSPHDRITVWGPWVWDCGHGEPTEVSPDIVFEEAMYRTEIHPPVGWVVYRNSANSEDRDGAPRSDKRTQSPWVWYESDDWQGTGATVPTSGGTLDTPIQATVADAFFSSFGGNVPEALNGCDDSTLVSSDTADSTCFAALNSDTFEWLQPLLQRDYSFFIPAPPKPPSDAIATMVWESEDRCSEVPSDPGNPPGDDVEDVLEADDTADHIGSPTCNTIPDEVSVAIVNGQPGIQVMVKAATGGVSYPSNGYIAFAKRYKVAWDHVEAGAQRPHTYTVNFQTLKVHDDTDSDTGGDGEWVVSLRVNEKWIHPVRGHGDDDDPFWEDGALAAGSDYSIGESLTVTPMAGQPVRVWMKGWDDDNAPITHNNNFNDIIPQINQYHYMDDLPAEGESLSFTVAGAASYIGEGLEGGGAYDLVYSITDVSDPQPPPCCISFGDPQFGPGPETNGLLRVNGTAAHETPILVAHQDVDGLEWRATKVEQLVPSAWEFDFDDANGLRIDLPSASSASGTYSLQWATVRTTDGRRIVSPREGAQIELDNTPPTLVVPDDFSVFATETAGAHVDYTVEVSDNFPGPVTYVCDPPSGALFPNGKNAPLTTTVTCVATDAVDNQTTDTFNVTVISPFGYLKDFVVLGFDWANLGGNVQVVSGNVGAFDTSAGVPTAPGFEVVTGSSVNLAGGPQIAAESDKLGNNSSSGDVFYVTPISAGNGAVFNPRLGYVPLFLGLPVAAPNGPGGQNLSLSGMQSLAPGDYGSLIVEPNANVTFTGGVYTFDEIQVKPGAGISFDAPTMVLVSDRVDIGNNSHLGPTLASGTAPRDIVISVNGLDGPGSHHALAIGGHAEVRLDAFVPNGTLSIEAFTQATGAFLGRRVDIGSNVVLELDSSFLVP